MKNLMQLLPLLSLFALSSSCAHIETIEPQLLGPIVNPCIVDIKSEGYQCAGRDSASSFVAFKDIDLRCVSPSELEQFIKACKEGKLIPLTYLTPPLADNSFCLNQKEWQRIGDRCVQ